MGKFNVKEYFENKKAKEAAKEDILNEMRGNGKGISNGKKSFSAADVNIRKAAFSKTLWPHHEEDNIDRIVKKEKYSDWQNRKYATKVEFPAEVKETRTFTDEFSFKDARNSKSVYRKADFNYNRIRIAAD